MEQEERQKKERTPNRHYSWELKREIIEEYLYTGASKASLLRKHDIRFGGAFQLWMRQLGYEDIVVKKPYFEDLSRIELKKIFADKSGPAGGQQEALKKRIAELERQLEDEKLRSAAYNMMIDIAERELKISIRKNPIPGDL